MKARVPGVKAARLGFGGVDRWLALLRKRKRHSPLWTMVGGIVGSTILFWVMVQLGQASSESKQKMSSTPQHSATQGGPPPMLEKGSRTPEAEENGKSTVPSAAQGPAVDIPREVLDMLEQRKRDLDRREEAIRQNEERLMIVRSQVEELLEQNEALEKRIQNAQAKEERPAAQQAKAHAEKERLAQDQRTQLAKMYESMPSEDAAARLERLPDRKAIEILRLVKSKTAGAILSQVKADRAAKLTEQLLAQMP